MSTNGSPEVTELLVAWSNGSHDAGERLIPLVYDELRRIASRHLRHERAEHTLETSALAHEAYLRLVRQQSVRWQNRSHFFAIAAQMMRRILVDHARQRRYAKRGGDRVKISLDEVWHLGIERAPDLVALDDALDDLAQLDERKSRVVELRFFGGLSAEEIAEVMQISTPTVNRYWRFARAWLYKSLSRESDSTGER